MNLARVVRFYNEFSPASVARFPELYSEEATFKDPFNEVSGIEAIQRIFAHMFNQVDAPRFVVTEHLRDANTAMLIWEFRYRVKAWGKGEEHMIRGVSHLRFDAAGKVMYHRDYWDAAEELYEKLPLIGALVRRLRTMFTTKSSASASASLRTRAREGID